MSSLVHLGRTAMGRAELLLLREREAHRGDLVLAGGGAHRPSNAAVVAECRPTGEG